MCGLAWVSKLLTWHVGCMFHVEQEINMDPNANLAAQGRLLDASSTYDKRRRAELRRALQGWIANGGFQPDWKAYPAATKAYRKWVRKSAKFADLWR